MVISINTYYHFYCCLSNCSDCWTVALVECFRLPLSLCNAAGAHAHLFWDTICVNKFLCWMWLLKHADITLVVHSRWSMQFSKRYTSPLLTNKHIPALWSTPSEGSIQLTDLWSVKTTGSVNAKFDVDVYISATSRSRTRMLVVSLW